MSIKLNSTLGGSVTLNEPATASAFTLTLPTDNIQPGMNLITPTSVVGGTFNGGAISFSAATSVSVNGCFTTAYDNYRIFMQMTSSAGGALTERLRVAGSDISAANYAQQRLDGSGTSVSASRSTAQTSWFGLSLVTTLNMFNQDLISPALATVTMGTTTSNRDPAATDVTITNVGYNAATAVDGFSLICATGNMSGTIRIYGLRNQ